MVYINPINRQPTNISTNRASKDSPARPVRYTRSARPAQVDIYFRSLLEEEEAKQNQAYQSQIPNSLFEIKRLSELLIGVARNDPYSLNLLPDIKHKLFYSLSTFTGMDITPDRTNAVNTFFENVGRGKYGNKNVDFMDVVNVWLGDDDTA